MCSILQCGKILQPIISIPFNHFVESNFFTWFIESCIDFSRGLGYASGTFADLNAELFPGGYIVMQWTAPAFEEVCLNCEINSYASAKL
jgi:coenzyme PQQ precursor peptide PqqA